MQTLCNLQLSLIIERVISRQERSVIGLSCLSMSVKIIAGILTKLIFSRLARESCAMKNKKQLE